MKSRFIKHRGQILLQVILFFVTSFAAHAQIGINTTTPDNSAALEIVPKAGSYSGILIPRMLQADRIAIPSPAKGLMVFDLTDNIFYVNLSAGTPNWYALNPWVTNATNGTPADMLTLPSVKNVGIGVGVPAAKLDVNGSIKSNSVVVTQTLSANTITVPAFPPNPLVPAGLISMWNGATAPAGWGLCDGTTYVTGTGTITSPDLRGRFILSSGTNTAPAVGDINPAYTFGQKGGENTHKLTDLESGLPVHGHTSPPHGHGSANGVYSSGPGPTDVYAMGNAECCTNAGTPPFPNATVTINNSTSQNAANAHENRPPYYVLAYIIKLP